MLTTLYLTAALFYLLASSLQWRALQKKLPANSAINKLAVLAVLFHFTAGWYDNNSSGIIDVSLLHVLSLAALIMAIIIVASRIFGQSLLPAGLIAFPITAIILFTLVVAPDTPLALMHITTDTRIHVFSSMLAFAMFGVATVYALFILALDYFLRSHRVTSMIEALPPLEVLDKVLLRLVSIGFIALSIGLASGFIFIDNLFAQHLLHKTVLSLIAWLVFAILIMGRWRYGWRGRTAVRLTLIGMWFLILAYFGSKLVLEVFMETGWQQNPAEISQLK
ncbi:MAG: cytochrome c biogenesis protein CcsA [Xanthomonadales bacterium]|nr:cytochrome c biogenesis protein CcsA [Xanthomonadales bacterium]